MGENFIKFVESKPNLKFMFTGGKGGVGKTICAAGIAYHFAERGEKTLIVSLNPVHSLSSVFGQDLWGGKIKPVKGVDNLWACEVDISETVSRYKEQIAGRLREFMKWADIPINPDPFVEVATTNPAFEESAMFDDMVDIMIKQGVEYNRIIFDCAAVANAVRLLGLSKIYGLWLTRMMKSREEALSLRVKLSFRKEKIMEEVKKDPMMADLLSMNERMKNARVFLNDDEKTAFFFVTLPLALPIAVVKRFIGMVEAFDIPVGGVFVNMVMPESIVKGHKVTEYLTNKFKEQQGYMQIISKDLGKLVRAYIPMFSTEVTGLEMIKKVSDALISGEMPV
ncbi:arsenic transporter [Candidatus Bathyarchaeota archaeon CG_4_8_14_3_um_filter_42_8]|nr:MAG: arsenic transporter [Candidatus Bathyarchaeota archaeon CG_4_8_14_3_um_filter_42_8]